jgi:hypothetical protein
MDKEHLKGAAELSAYVGKAKGAPTQLGSVSLHLTAPLPLSVNWSYRCLAAPNPALAGCSEEWLDRGAAI